MGFGFVELCVKGFAAEQTTLIIGVLTCFILLLLISEPAIAMFFYSELKARKARKDSWWHRCTNAIFAGNMVVTTKHVYVVLWGVLLLLAMKDMSGSITATGWNGWAPNSHNWKSHTHINTADDFYD